MRAKLRLERDNGTVVTTQPALTAEITRSFDEQARASVRLTRDDWSVIESALAPRTDRFFVVIDGEDEFGGRFDDSDRQQGAVTVRLNSPEIDAKTAEPTPDNLTYENVDPETILTETINAVPTLSLGQLELSASAVSYTISHGSRSKVLYDLRSQIGAEFRYNSDFTVDVVDRLGADRDIVLSPTSENIGEDFTKTVDERENVTHVVGLGGQSGPNQLRREAVAPSYEGGRKIYRRYENKEIIDGSRLQDTIDELVREYDGEPRSIDVETTVYGEDLTLGDRVRVEYPAKDLERRLRVVSLTDRIGRDGRERRVTLSSRSLTRESRQRKRNDDLQRFNRGYGGFVDRDNFRAVERQPVSGSLAAVGEYPYPDDVVREETAELTVRSLPYRAFSSGANSGGDHTHTVDVSHPQHSHTISGTTGASSNENHNIGSSFTASTSTGENQLTAQTIATETVDSSPDSFPLIIRAGIGIEEGDGNSFDQLQLQVFDRDTSTVYIIVPDTSRTEPFNFASGNTVIFDDVNGHTLDLQILNSYTDARTTDLAIKWGWDLVNPHTHGVNETSSTELGVTQSETSDASGTHTHPPDPGVVESFPNASGANANDELLASNVDVVIDNTTVASDIGSGEFTKTIDISGELSAGVNDIQIQSDSLGLVSAYVQTELFRRGRTS